MERVTCLGPAADMSLSSKGISWRRVTVSYIRSTVVTVPKFGREIEGEKHQEEEESEEKARAEEGCHLPAPGSVEDAPWTG